MVDEDNVAHADAVQASKNADSTPPRSMHYEEQVDWNIDANRPSSEDPSLDPSVDLDKWEPQQPSDDQSFPAQVTPAPSELVQGLREVINRSSAENGSGTPDFILATFLEDVLYCFDRTVRDRAAWRGESTEAPALISLHREQEQIEKTMEQVRSLIEQGIVQITPEFENDDLYRHLKAQANKKTVEVPLIMYTRGQRNDIGTAQIWVSPGEALADKPIVAVLAEFGGDVPDAAYSGETSLLGEPPLDVPKDEPRPATRFERYQKEGLSGND